MNGGVIIGTRDGANIEIADAVGEDNIFIFGQSAEQIARLQTTGYDPAHIVGSNAELRRVIERIASWGPYGPIVDALMKGDRYFHCLDFASYVDTQKRAADTWMRRADWARRSILNTARSSSFSSDRTVEEYAREIWGVQAVPVSVDR